MMDAALLEELRTRLVDRRQEILQRLDNYGEALAYLEQSRPTEFSEEAQEEAAANSLKALDQRERRELAEIVLALNRMDSGEYGVCERCEKRIGAARLNALPMVRFCIDCQKRLESNS
jgi:DnaK suppressor protein